MSTATRACSIRPWTHFAVRDYRGLNSRCAGGDDEEVIDVRSGIAGHDRIREPFERFGDAMVFQCCLEIKPELVGAGGREAVDDRACVRAAAVMAVGIQEGGGDSVARV